eukprot:gene12338-13612_t
MACNRFIQGAARRLWSKDIIVSEVKKAKYFSILADEATDVSNMEQMAVVLRYVHDCKIEEAFMGFIHGNKGLKGTEIAATILRTVHILGRDPVVDKDMTGRVTIKEFVPNACHTRFIDVCRTHWIARIDGLDVFVPLYEPIVFARFRAIHGPDNELGSSHLFAALPASPKESASPLPFVAEQASLAPQIAELTAAVSALSTDNKRLTARLDAHTQYQPQPVQSRPYVPPTEVTVVGKISQNSQIRLGMVIPIENESVPRNIHAAYSVCEAQHLRNSCPIIKYISC